MNQLSLFDTLTTPTWPQNPSWPQNPACTENIVLGPETAPVTETTHVAEAPMNKEATPVASPKPSNTSSSLLALAELIRQGRESMQAEQRQRSQEVQTIGALAQSVLIRHDLVARRRAASQQTAEANESVATEVHVAS